MPPAGGTYDVRVVAFRSARAQTLAALQQTLGIDGRAAQRLMDAAPVVVKRGSSAAQARAYQQALQAAGAEVVLSRAGAAPAPPRSAPHAAAKPAAPSNVPARSRYRPPSGDLELDLGAETSEPTSADPAPPAHASAQAGDEHAGANTAPSDGLREQVVFGAEALALPTATTGPRGKHYAAGASPAARDAMAAQQRAAGEPSPMRLPLLRLLVAVVIFGLGAHLDNSILYGSASWPSLGLHACAIYQLGLGLRGIFV